MTDLDNLKVMLTKVGQKFEVNHDNMADEIDVIFTPEGMPEEVVFVFNTEGGLKDIL